jgi:nitrite reductase (NADH) small subunit
VPPGAVRLVHAGQRAFALVNLDGAYYALDNNCPHNGGPLAKGCLIGAELECPWHGWRWDVRNGRSTHPVSNWRAMRVPVKLDGDNIQLPEF